MDNLVHEGEILAGKYRVDRVLGAGGMGVVVAAHHLELDAKVAIKFLLPHTLGNADAVARFAREARAAVKIRSEHVARVSDVGKLASGAPYMVMEYLEGLDLSQWLTERGPLPVEQALEFVLQASEAVAEAHALGIVHRDLKPANLFVIRRPDGGLSIKVLDFGISKMTSLGGSSGEGSMTKTSTMLGSPIYMSPEQIQSSKDVDARGDIWALGVILYELITGAAPFGGEHMAELIFAIISSAPPPMRSFRAGIPDGLERVIFRCLAKNRSDRFASIADMAAALLPFAPQRSLVSVERISGVTTGAFPTRDAATVVTGPPSPAETASPYVPAGTQASWGNTRDRSQDGAAPASTAIVKKRSPWLVVAVLGVGVALMAGLFITRGSTATAVAASSSPAAMSALLPPPAVASQVDTPKPEPTLPVASATTATAPSATPSASVKDSSRASPASARPSPPPPAKPKPTPPATPPGPHDPWGGSQH